jgi:hypothetical protein
MGVCAGFLMRSPDAAQHHKRVHAHLSTRYGGALLIRGPHLASLGPGSAAQRAGRCFASPSERCTASGTRDMLHPHSRPLSNRQFLMRSPDAAQHHKRVHARLSTRYGGALLIRGPHLAALGPGSAAQRAGRCFASPGERCTASGTRDMLHPHSRLLSNRQFHTRFRILAAQCVRGLPKISALKTEGVGNAGRPMHPQPRVRYW